MCYSPLNELRINKHNLTKLVLFLSKKYYRKLLSDKKTDDSAVINCERTFKYMRKHYICSEALYASDCSIIFFIKKNIDSETEYSFKISEKLYKFYLDDYIRSSKIKNVIS